LKGETVKYWYWAADIDQVTLMGHYVNSLSLDFWESITMKSIEMNNTYAIFTPMVLLQFKKLFEN